MSGGSMNYLYSKLEYDATFEQNTPERVAFAEHLKLVAEALHDIEWVDSGDYGGGRETAAILACLGGDVAAERERIKSTLLAWHERDKDRHNYWLCAVVELFGEE